MRLLALAILALSVLLGACAEPWTADDDPSRAQIGAAAGHGNVSPVTPTLDARWRGTMTVTPAAASRGQSVALRFGSKKVRGIAFSLASWGEGGWTVAYYLGSDWGSPESHSPDWWSVEDDEGRGWPDVGIGGPGPDRVIVPDSAPAGVYLLCTANSADEACALLNVSG